MKNKMTFVIVAVSLLLTSTAIMAEEKKMETKTENEMTAAKAVIPIPAMKPNWEGGLMSLPDNERICSEGYYPAVAGTPEANAGWSYYAQQILNYNRARKYTAEGKDVVWFQVGVTLNNKAALWCVKADDPMLVAVMGDGGESNQALMRRVAKMRKQLDAVTAEGFGSSAMMMSADVAGGETFNINDKLIVALRINATYTYVPAPFGYNRGGLSNNDFFATTGDVIFQLRNFLGPNWGLEFATGIGAGFYPNGESVFYGIGEGGLLWHPGNVFEMMLGYSVGVGGSTVDTLLQNHAGVLRFRFYLVERFGFEIAGHCGWGSHAWDVSHEYQAPNPDEGGELWWYEEIVTRHHNGVIGGASAGFNLRW